MTWLRGSAHRDMVMTGAIDKPAQASETAQLRTAAAFVLVALIWGSTWLVIKHQIAAGPAGWTITWRFALACPCMFLLAWWRGDPLRLSPAGAKLAVIVGVLHFCGNFQFVYRAEQHVTSGLVAVFFALLMVPNALLAWAWLGVGITRRFLLGSAVAIVGIGLLLLHEYRLAPPSSDVPLGLVLMLGALLCASASNVLQASEAVRGQPLVPQIAWAMLAGVVANAALAFATAGPPVFSTSPAYWAGVVYLGVAGSAVTFPLYFTLIRTMGAGRAAYNGVAVPVIAMGLSTLFEGYRWSVLAGSGAALALAGLLIALSGRNNAPSPSR